MLSSGKVCEPPDSNARPYERSLEKRGGGYWEEKNNEEQLSEGKPRGKDLLGVRKEAGEFMTMLKGQVSG